MPIKKITDLTDIGTPASDDLLEIVDVSDTTDSPEGTSKKVLVSALGGGGGVTEFIELTDVPASYTGQGSKVVAVKVDESGLEFVAGGGSQDLQETLDNGSTATTSTGKIIDLTNNIELISNEAYVGALSIDNQVAVYVAVSDLGDGIEPYIVFINNNNNAILNLRISDLTNERNVQFPDKDGTIAFLSDISGGGAVDSVNGQTGVVVLDSDDINEGTTNLYFTDTRALGAIPDATPTVKGIAKLYTSLGSNTDGAVDQNTVNTALSAKANAPLIDTVSSSALTGVTTEGILKTYLISANTYTASEILNFANDLYKTGTAGTVTSRLYTNTTNSLSGASLLATNISTVGNRKVPLRRQLVLKNGNIEVLLATSSTPDDNVNSSSPATIVTFNPAVDNYFITTAQNASAGDSTIQNNFKIHF